MIKANDTILQGQCEKKLANNSQVLLRKNKKRLTN